MKVENIPATDVPHSKRGKWRDIVMSLSKGEARKITIEDGDTNIRIAQVDIIKAGKVLNINVGTTSKDNCLYVFLRD